MLLLGLLFLLAALAQGANQRVCLRADVSGSIKCTLADTSSANPLLPGTLIQLRDEDIGEDDSIGHTYTTASGQFYVTGVECEYDNWLRYYVEVKVPCWDEAIKKCKNYATMCKRSDCEYYVWKWVPKEFRYQDGAARKVFRMDDFNVDTDGHEEGYSMCPE